MFAPLGEIPCRIEKVCDNLGSVVFRQSEDVAAAVVFLASPVSRNVIGAILNVDGGQTACF